MFGFLKKKLKNALSKFTKKVEEAPEEEVTVEKEVEVKPPVEEKIAPKVEEIIPEEKVEEKPPEVKPEVKVEKPVEVKPKEVIPEKPVEVPKVEPPEVKVEVPKPKVEPVKVYEVKTEPKVEEKKGFLARLKEKVLKEKPKVEETPVEKAAKAEALPEEYEKEKKGFFKKITETITTKKISEKQFDELFWDLELALLENNAAVEVIEKIKQDLKKDLLQKPIPRLKVQDTIVKSLRQSISGLFEGEEIDLIKMAKEKKPLIICLVGINGSGKTTSIAKLTKMFQNNNLGVVLAAADTFRAAAIDQLQLHADKLGVKLIKHDYGSDAAAVAFDAVKYAEAKNKDVVLIDTAGRLHSNVNLMDEMKKIVRVAKPDFNIFIGESITGNDCVEQAKKFDEAIGIDGILLSKADVDEKGGAAISVSYVTKKPILYLGTGQEYDDLQAFDKNKLLASIGL